MNNKAFWCLSIFIFILVFWNCNKSEEEGPAEDLVFHSLVAEKDTIIPGEETSIKATATGSQLEYFWEAKPGGSIIGTGFEVRYAAGPCELGKNMITCKVTNGSRQSENKSIYIVVYEY